MKPHKPHCPKLLKKNADPESVTCTCEIPVEQHRK